MMPRKYLVAMVALMAAPAVAGLAMRPLMAPSVPVHWGIGGQPDRYDSPWELILTFGITNLAVGGLMLCLPALGPLRANFKRFEETYGRICVTLMAGMTVIAIALLFKAAGRNVPVLSAITVTLGVMLAMVGNWLGKVRRNFWVGIRTPWTLANERVWERTHRVGGRLMLLYGVAIAVAGALATPVAVFSIIIAGAVALVVWSLVYSYVLYRKLGRVDDMAPPAGV